MKVSAFALRFMIEMYHSSDEETSIAFVIDICCLAHVKIAFAVLCAGNENTLATLFCHFRDYLSVRVI